MNHHPALHRQALSDLLHRTAARLPRKTAIVCGETRWTWAEFDALVSRLAAGLHAHRLIKGEHVGVLSRNSHGFAALRLALARLGAVMVPVNFMLNADEAAQGLPSATSTGPPRLSRFLQVLLGPASAPLPIHSRHLLVVALPCRIHTAGVAAT